MGVSTLEEAIQLYEQFDPGIIIRNYPNGESVVFIQFVNIDIEDGTPTRHILVGLNGVLIEAEIQVRKEENFTPTALMQQYGQPSEVWLWTIPEPYERLLPAYIDFYFSEQGIMSIYAEPARNVREGEYVEICFRGNGGSTLLLWNPDIWDPDGSKTFVERANRSSELKLKGAEMPISEVSNWNEETLYINVLDPDSKECLQTPSELWSPP